MQFLVMLMIIIVYFFKKRIQFALKITLENIFYSVLQKFYTKKKSLCPLFLVGVLSCSKVSIDKVKLQIGKRDLAKV